MPIENMMYFALGLLVAGLLALIVMPAVWKRAVRLTKRRIEAATPITLSEFRADKDQLRAEFALELERVHACAVALDRVEDGDADLDQVGDDVAQCAATVVGHGQAVPQANIDDAGQVGLDEFA